MAVMEEAVAPWNVIAPSSRVAFLTAGATYELRVEFEGQFSSLCFREEYLNCTPRTKG